MYSHAIETHDLSRQFGDLHAVRKLNLQVPAGSLFGFLGPNGAGKTTTIRLLIGILRPSAGTAIVAGHDVSRSPQAVKRSVGYLAQSPLLYERLTGREFLRFMGGIFGMRDEESDAHARYLLGLLDLTSKGDDVIESYSGGMKRKIGLCGALLHKPEVLVLDEPLAGMDPAGARRIKDLLREYCLAGNTVFLSTHVLEIAERVCDQVAILNQGKLIAAGSLDALRKQAQSASDTSLEDLFLALTGNADAMELIRMLD